MVRHRHPCADPETLVPRGLRRKPASLSRNYDQTFTRKCRRGRGLTLPAHSWRQLEAEIVLSDCIHHRPATPHCPVGHRTAVDDAVELVGRLDVFGGVRIFKGANGWQVILCRLDCLSETDCFAWPREPARRCDKASSGIGRRRGLRRLARSQSSVRFGGRTPDRQPQDSGHFPGFA